jgi:hypothetical protein
MSKILVSAVGLAVPSWRMSGMERGRNLLISAVVVVFLSVATSTLAWKVPTPQWPRWGFTHSQFSADHGVEAAVSSVANALRVQTIVQVQPIMGWGADNPEPAPGVYNFDSLDSRIDFIRRSGGTPVITLCCAPDWMKGGRAGHTDWGAIEAAPLPDHYSDFAELSAAVARRYPDVQYFMVWNELKGFFDNQTMKWDARAYTELYNEVYAALKAVRSNILVGGPYMGMTTVPTGSSRASTLFGSWGAVDQRSLDVVEYWLRQNHGADFIVVDGHATTNGGGPDEFAALRKFSAVTSWIRQRTSLPVWWAEWYVEPDQKGWPPERSIALRTAALIEMARSGVDTAIYWNPKPGGADCATCLWTDTRVVDGGVPLPFLHTLQEFARSFPRGTRIDDVPEPPGVRILAQPHRLIAVNTLGEERAVEIDGHTVALGPYETRWLSRGEARGE